MRRAVVVAGFALLSMFVWPQPSEAADFWGWIKALSGPGPFKGPQFDLRLACFAAPPETLYRERLDESLTQAVGFLGNSLKVANRGAEEGKVIADVVRDAEALATDLHPLLLATSLETLVEKLTTCANCPLATAAASHLKKAASAAHARNRYRETVAGDRYVAAALSASLCPFEKRPGKVSIGVVTRFLSWTDEDPGERYAGGNLMRHQSLSLTFTWRPIDGVTHPKLDIFDFGFGAGMYRFTSDDKLEGGIADLSGLLLEPLQIGVHLPSQYRKGWLLLVPFGQFNRLIFWDGFGTGAFGPDLVGPKAQAIPKSDGVWNLEFFWDLTPLFDKIRK